MKPSAVRLRSERNWIRSWFPSENTGLQRNAGKERKPRRNSQDGCFSEKKIFTYAGGLSPQYLPIRLASLISAPLKMETWS